MKKSFALIAAIFAALALCIGFASSDDSRGFCCETREDRYSLTRPFDSFPRTLEAYFRCEAVYGHSSGDTIIGNYFDKSLPGMTMRVYSNGVPQLVINYDAKHQSTFTPMISSILGQGPVHVAFTIDDSYVYCYVNGELQLKRAHSGYLPKLGSIPFSVGGDISEENDFWFSDGAIYQIHLFSEYRTQEQIRADMHNVDLHDDSLMLSYDFTLSNTDASICQNDIYPYYYSDSLVSTDEYDYTWVAVGDTQTMFQKYPELAEHMYEFIVDNFEALKIERVIGLGDITDGCTDREWKDAAQALALLDGKIPYSLVRGNHDLVKEEKFSEYFDTKDYSLQYDGRFEDSINNTFCIREIGSRDYLFINLDYAPSDAVLEWACDLCEKYSNCNVIISTHSFLNESGNLNGHGKSIWKNLASKHKNISMVICGHIPTNNTICSRYTGINGNTVTCLLIDQQYVDKYIGPSGMLTFLHFSDGGRTMCVETYSTVKGKLYKKNNQFVVEGINVLE